MKQTIAATTVLGAIVDFFVTTSQCAALNTTERILHYGITSPQIQLF
jgi:hypothetical protein